MGKYIRKCKGIEEVAVMDVAQVGVRTRARALAIAEAESSALSKRRKVSGGELAELTSSSSLVQLSFHSQSPENSVSAEYSTANPNDQHSSPSFDQIPASCCSSNGSAEVSNEELNFADLEEEESVKIETTTHNFDCRERRKMTPLREHGEETGELEPTAARPSKVDSRRQSPKMPSEAELEEFFAVAEKDLQKKFTDKYNFDFVKDKPLEGRYEWVRVKP